MKIKILISVITLMACIGANAQARLGFDGEEHASVGIYVKNLSTGQVLAQNDAAKAMLPASVMKSITAAVTLTELGEDFAFETPVYLYGKPNAADPSQWDGNLVVESCGDPTIDSELFKTRMAMRDEIASGLHAKGIRCITGRIIISEPMLDQGCIPQWEIDDVAWAYGAGLYGFNYRDNYFKLWPATGRTNPYVPNLNLSVIQSEGGTDLIRGICSNNLVVYGKDPTNPKWVTNVSMSNPAEIFTEELHDKLNNMGIAVLNQEINDESTRLHVCTHQSPFLPDILHQMMVESDNLYAEGMLRALAPGGTREEAIDVLKGSLKAMGLSTAYNSFCDGSGLARADGLQAQFISQVLEKMAKTPYGDMYVSLFPRAGKEGTVKSLLAKTSLEGKLALKSGSMGAVQCFAGYALDSSDRPTHTVVILVNNFYCPRGQLRGAIEKFLVNTLK